MKAARLGTGMSDISQPLGIIHSGSRSRKEVEELSVLFFWFFMEISRAAQPDRTFCDDGVFSAGQFSHHWPSVSVQHWKVTGMAEVLKIAFNFSLTNLNFKSHVAQGSHTGQLQKIWRWKVNKTKPAWSVSISQQAMKSTLPAENS